MTNTHRRRTIGAMIALLGVFALLTPGVAQAQDDVIELPLDTEVRSDPGVTTVLATGETPDELVGRDCTVEARGENNSSEHPDTDLVVTSGPQTVRLEDVEAVAGKVTTASARLLLGETYSIAVVMGPDGIFSGSAAARVIFDCRPIETTTTTTVAVSPASIAPTTTAEVLAQVQVAPPAQATPSEPSFTG